MSTHDEALEILNRHLRGAQSTQKAVEDEIELQQAHLAYDEERGNEEEAKRSRKKLDAAEQDLPLVRAKAESLAGSIDVLIKDRNETEPGH